MRIVFFYIALIFLFGCSFKEPNTLIVDDDKYRSEEEGVYSNLLMILDRYAKRMTESDTTTKFIFFIESDTLGEIQYKNDTFNLVAQSLPYRIIDQHSFNKQYKNKLIRTNKYLTLAEQQSENSLYEGFKRSNVITPNIYHFSRVLFNNTFTLGVLEYSCYPNCGGCTLIIKKQNQKWSIVDKIICLPPS